MSGKYGSKKAQVSSKSSVPSTKQVKPNSTPSNTNASVASNQPREKPFRNRNNDRAGPSRIRIIQNFVLVWLDSTINESDPAFKHSQTQLHRIVNTIDVFQDVEQCLNHVQTIKDIRIFMILSDILAESVLTSIHDMAQLEAVYITCTKSCQQEKWTTRWTKVEGLFTQIDPICDALRKDIHRSDHDSISISVTGSNLNQLDPSFMYTQLLKEILIEMSQDDQEKDEFIDFCRNQYANNQHELQMIDEFEREYKMHSPIWWYTRESFAYHILNCALRTEDVEAIIKMRFFLRDLHRQIEKLHAKIKQRDSFTVYRGQALSNSDFEKIKSSENGLLAFNNFLSTSLSREISMGFARFASCRPNCVGVIFYMNVDPNVSRIPFAHLDNISFYEDSEKEVLFSMHTIFRIGQVKPVEDQIWSIELRSASENDDQQLKRLTEHVRNDIKGRTAWHRINRLLIKTGNFDKAEEMCQKLFQQTSPDEKHEISTLYYQLAFIKQNQNEPTQALELYQKSLDNKRDVLPSNHSDFAETYKNMGILYDNMGEYSKAIDFYQKSLQIYRKTVPPNHRELAINYSNIATVFKNQKEHSKALEYYEKALENDSKSVPVDYVSLVITYNNIGLMHKRMKEYPKALESYFKSLTAYQNIENPDRAWLANIYVNLASLYEITMNYAEALKFYRTLLAVREEILSSGHPVLGSSYRSIGSIHYYMEQYNEALECYLKAVKIYQVSLPQFSMEFYAIYNEIGRTYEKMKAFDKAKSYFELADDIKRKSESPDDASHQS